MQQGQKDSEIKLFYRAAASPLLALQSASHRSKNAEKLTQRRRFQPQGKRSWKSKVIRAWLKSIPQKNWLFAKPGWGDGGHHGLNSLFEEKYVFFFRDHAGGWFSWVCATSRALNSFQYLLQPHHLFNSCQFVRFSSSPNSLAGVCGLATQAAWIRCPAKALLPGQKGILKRDIFLENPIPRLDFTCLAHYQFL